MRKTKSGPIRAVVVDDSPAMRDLLTAILRNVGGIEIAGVGANGEEAVQLTKRLQPDVVTLDVRMPKMDGLEATRRIMREAPTPIVIVTSSQVKNEVNLSFEALQAGALAVVSKPALNDSQAHQKLALTVRLMADVPVIHHWGRPEGKLYPETNAQGAFQVAPFVMPPMATSPCIVGIAASTGGPAALATILGALPANFRLPILIVQHITRGFTAGLAAWLNTQTPLQIVVATHGAMPQSGQVLLAPDDYHIEVDGRGAIRLSKAPPYRGLRPSANYLFESLARAYGPRAIGIVLTGMGDDGADGLQALHQAGGPTMAQDEKSCIVYGMPHEAVLRNAVDQVLSPDQIAVAIARAGQSPPGA